MKYSNQIANWLVEEGYTHCFFVAGGNNMHLVESFSRKLECRPFVHEVAAGVAAEYFNETSPDSKALALVTAGPELTNIITAMAGAYLESRELLVIGGQAKTTDLANGKLRQNGIQEIGGVDIAKSICLNAVTMFVSTNKPWKPTKKILDMLEINEYFHEILTIDSGCFGNKSDMVSKILTTNDAISGVVIGDSIDDFESAVDNQLDFIYCSYGYGFIRNTKGIKVAPNVNKMFDTLLTMV